MDVIVDIDGTVADLTHRRHFIASRPKNYDAFFAAVKQDVPIQPVVDAVKALRGAGNQLIFVSGRPERTRHDTLDWLEYHARIQVDPVLCMRKDGDYRPDDIVKEELLAKLRQDGYDPKLAFDDRNRVVAMWRRNGIICAQVAEGDF